MSISDTIAVMREGVIQHLGTPREIYQRPQNLFVATFIGQTNILPGRIQNGTLVFHSGHTAAFPGWESIPDQQVQISIRPEEFVIGPENGEGIPGTVVDSIYLGLNTHYIVDVGLEHKVELIRESAIDDTVVPGSRISLSIKREKINIFDAQGNANLLRG